MIERQWEVWTSASVAKELDAYWRSSEDEKAHRRRLAQIIKDEMARSHDTLLEVGCGTGLVYREIARRTPRLNYVGVDNSPHMLTIARRRYRRPKFLEDDAFALSFGDDSFDIVFSFEVFGHMPDCRRPMEELYRVCRRAMLFTVWAAEIPDILPMGDGRYHYPMSWIREELSKFIDYSDAVEEIGMPNGITCWIVRKT